jgi:hypothetical protein
MTTLLAAIMIGIRAALSHPLLFPDDDANGPYPAVILVHGTASFRVASASTQAHWASHGFVVMSADHPDLCLGDVIAACRFVPQKPTHLSTDVDSEISALTNPTDTLSFLAGHVDMTRIALVDHSAGAYYVGQFSDKPHVQVIIELSGTTATTASASLKSTLFVSGLDDTVLPYASGTGIGSILYGGPQLSAYDGSPAPKRIFGITGGGHLTVTDLRQTNDAGKNAMQVMQERGVGGTTCLAILPSLFDCGTIDWKTGVGIVSDITTGVLEEVLHCQNRVSMISDIKSRHAEVGDFREAL